MTVASGTDPRCALASLIYRTNCDTGSTVNGSLSKEPSLPRWFRVVIRDAGLLATLGVQMAAQCTFFKLSKQICEECLDILYGENTFYLCLDIGAEDDLKHSFTEQNRCRLRHLVVVVKSEIYPGKNGRLFQESVWATGFPNLKSLTIFIMQPIEAQERLTQEEEIAEWVEGISAYLQCSRKYIPETLQVLVVDDGDNGTTELVEKYLSPSGWL